jgi:hypothetical protein
LELSAQHMRYTRRIKQDASQCHTQNCADIRKPIPTTDKTT